ncbi:zinc-dependent alcohol dehydrogenase [Geomonas azotofigens]|uniref:zinc-dependent alcohol dehydrogenase n=1 Tax=Geomonas azotofigens TaxID=2843196 RepID=UPI001C10DF52|nr:zinc-dependent alcohol dehydrogenase [Geomonas azotofigens]MBU5611931.1 glutathione-dependent formaldehyde dehydrogenase [Geomonas azotofigens]
MRAVCWHGKHDVRVDEVADPQIVSMGDVIVKVALTCICGSDLHLYNGYVPTMKKGDIMGHEFVGEIIEVGSGVKRFHVGDRVIVPFPISCGVCWYCKHELWSLCDNSNPNSWMLEHLYGDTGGGIFGYSHMYGGFSGGQAEYVRVPFADVGLEKIPDGIPYEQVVLLTDIFPTGYQAADNCNINPGDTVAVWGCGPVGLMAMMSARHLGAERVIGIDRFPDRLQMAHSQCRAEVLNYEEVDVAEALQNMTGGRGPDSCIDAVGLEAVGTGIEGIYDSVKQTLRLENDRASALRQLTKACRKGGTLSIVGVYSGFIDKFPMGAIFAKGLTLHAGQAHVHKYLPHLVKLVAEQQLNPSSIITHRLPLEQAPGAYKTFLNKQDSCIKIVLNPQESARTARPGIEEAGAV